MDKRIVVSGIYKSYNGQQVLNDFSQVFSSGTINCVMGNSGIGKTTLMRILMGLEKPDSGSVDSSGVRFSAVFQDNRLVEQLTAVANVKMVLPKNVTTNMIEESIKEILPAECLYKSVSELSGGMKRRIAIVRAMLSKSDAVILDEPFTGLDVDTKKQVMEYVKRHADGRIIILVTHDEMDVSYFNAVKCLLTTA